MLKKIIQGLVAFILILILGGTIMAIGGAIAVFNPPQAVLAEDAILDLSLDGVIIDGKEFLETLSRYRKDERIKGVLITLNSPGGVVGPSQEIYREIQRTSQEFKKPVYVYCRSLAASGAYYAAVGADRIFTTPGCFLGSIGVLMEFVNLERLYNWAKIERFALTTGPFKDTGAEYRPMRPNEREYLQTQLHEVLEQFKTAVLKGRKLRRDVVNENADGRVFSGAKAVELGFADEIGTWEDAREALGELVGLGKDAKVFKPRRPKSFMEILRDGEDPIPFESTLKELFHTELKGQPLFLFPGYLGLAQ